MTELNQYYQYLQAFNEKQHEAFEKNDNTFVVAGPGSGKTRLLTMKIAQLLSEQFVPPQGIACITYTRIMAKELTRRLKLLGILDRPNIITDTVHAFCLGQVVQPFAKLYDDFEKIPEVIRIAPAEVWDASFNKARLQIYGIEYNPKKKESNDFRNNIIKYLRQYADKPFPDWENKKFAQFLQKHYLDLFSLGFLDFPIIEKIALQLILNYDLVRQSLCAKFAWLAVDEFQDLGYPLFKIVETMITKTPMKLFAIGDPDQTIYEFQGANPNDLNKLIKTPIIKQVIKLNTNYRSASDIIMVSKAILKPTCDYEAFDKELSGTCRIYKCENTQLKKHQYWLIPRLIQEYLNKGVKIENIAIFHPWRKNKDMTEGIEAIADTLASANKRYILDKHPLYDRSKNLIRWLENIGYWCLKGWYISDNQETSGEITFEELWSEWQQITQEDGLKYEITKEGFIELLWNLRGKNLLLGEWLTILKESLKLDNVLEKYRDIYPDDVTEFEKLYRLTLDNEVLSSLSLRKFANIDSGVYLTTLHSSKGTEFEVAIIAGVDQINFDENGRRLLYVGVSRAKKEICLLYTQQMPPRYLTEIKKTCESQGFLKWLDLTQKNI